MVAITVVMIILFMQRKNIVWNVAFDMTSNDIAKMVQSHSQKDTATITLFTTFDESYSKSYIHENVIRNWGLLSPDVIPVLFTSMAVSFNVLDYASQRKWHIFPVPKSSKGGLPILRHMFLEAQRLFNTTFYAYANGDILFDRSFTDTIHGLMKMKKKLTNIFVVGRRKNWPIKWQQKVTQLKEIGEYAKSSPLFIGYAQDYFISTRNGYPWSSIPNFVVWSNCVWQLVSGHSTDKEDSRGGCDIDH